MRTLPPWCLPFFVDSQAGGSGDGPMTTLIPCSSTFLTCLIAKMGNTALSLPPQLLQIHTVDATLLLSPQTVPMMWHVCSLSCCRYGLHHAAASCPCMVSTQVRLLCIPHLYFQPWQMTDIIPMFSLPTLTDSPFTTLQHRSWCELLISLTALAYHWSPTLQ